VVAGLVVVVTSVEAVGGVVADGVVAGVVVSGGVVVVVVVGGVVTSGPALNSAAAEEAELFGIGVIVQFHDCCVRFDP
jgi:hypothetical protein